MRDLNAQQIAARERTLLIALLLSMWAPLATGYAVMMSHSTTQLADFVRRTVDLVALFTSWFIFRTARKSPEMTEAQVRKREYVAGIFVAVALVFSSLTTIVLAITRAGTIPSGNVLLGLGIAVMGGVTNSFFWWKYCSLTRERHNVVINAQRQLYRAKTAVDICVIFALASVALFPTQGWVRYVDKLGSIAVGSYLLWSGVRMARDAATGLKVVVISHKS